MTVLEELGDEVKRTMADVTMRWDSDGGRWYVTVVVPRKPGSFVLSQPVATVTEAAEKAIDLLRGEPSA